MKRIRHIGMDVDKEGDTTSLLTSSIGWFINVSMSPAKKKATRSPPKKNPAPRPQRKKAPAKKKLPAKKSPTPRSKPAKDELGRVVAFFRIPVVAVIKLTQGSLKIGDRVWIKGHTTDLKQAITSMQINHQPITGARKGDEVGVKVSSRARIGDRVYRISA